MPNPRLSELAEHVMESPARCGTSRVVLIDGPAGSGKTTLANRLAEALGGARSAGAGTYDPDQPLDAGAPVQILHGDDMYEGWSGLATLHQILLGQILEPLAHGGQGSFRMWDWVEDRRSHVINVPAREVLIIEGVGVGLPRARDLASLVVFVEAPWEERLRRGVARDHHAYDDVVAKWQAFDAEEAALHVASATRDAAHFVVDGTSPVPD